MKIQFENAIIQEENERRKYVIKKKTIIFISDLYLQIII